jgi:hypothetical protein
MNSASYELLRKHFECLFYDQWAIFHALCLIFVFHVLCKIINSQICTYLSCSILARKAHAIKKIPQQRVEKQWTMQPGMGVWPLALGIAK